MWQAMVLLVIHGCAGVLWQTPNQMLLYDVVGSADLPSAVRLNAMARYLGVMVGPAVGGVILLALGRPMASCSTPSSICRWCCG
jgi:predicted MFS family arabinose efflux permease